MSISQRCQNTNATLIPLLLKQHMGNDLSVVDLGTAENHLVRHIVLAAETGWTIRDCDLSYTQGVGGSVEVRSCMAELINSTETFNPITTVDKSHIVLGAGASAVLSALIEQLCNPGDGVLIASPYWSGLDLAISIHKDAVTIPVHIPLETLFSPRCVQFYEDALSQSSIPIKAVVVCNPNNPLGRCYPEETLQAILGFCERQGLHYISDEVYALSTHRATNTAEPEERFFSALSLHGNQDLVHVIYSLSKDFGCSGIRLGALITQHNYRVRVGTALTTHGQASSVSSLFVVNIILRPKNLDFVRANSGRLLREQYLKVSNLLNEKGIRFIPVTAGMFVFARLCAGGDTAAEDEFGKQLKHFGLVLNSGSSYHFKETGWFRICFAVPELVLLEGLKRLAACLSL